MKLFNKNRITSKQIKVIKGIAEKLKNIYPFLINQCTKDFILRIHQDEVIENEYLIEYNAKLEQKFLRQDLPHLIKVSNIKVKNNRGKQEYIELIIVDGIISALNLTCKVSNLLIESINIDDIEIHNKDPKNELYNILNQEEINIISNIKIKNSIDIRIDTVVYYTIHDLKDGNYIAIDNSKSVFHISHDPFFVKTLGTNLLDYISKKDWCHV